ncbi:hypothetical protein VCB98_13120 [Gammaproteobacteria bacterium AB-CW1]|uniref:Uncharacterized protein n=1 Tax=Natronospira elongata TaxID=3110268 RepID=A0AAP6JGL5_9GAMM|nr:hypothetical protein [Gammaproteobacteria bacterium AB-CW1]
MSIQLENGRIRLQGHCEADQAETLVQTVRAHPDYPVDLSECQYLHTAVFQVLFCLGVRVVSEGGTAPIQDHLLTLLKQRHSSNQGRGEPEAGSE